MGKCVGNKFTEINEDSWKQNQCGFVLVFKIFTPKKNNECVLTGAHLCTFFYRTLEILEFRFETAFKINLCVNSIKKKFKP